MNEEMGEVKEQNYAFIYISECNKMYCVIQVQKK